jgi:hypothetical protein
LEASLQRFHEKLDKLMELRTTDAEKSLEEYTTVAEKRIKGNTALY